MSKERNFICTFCGSGFVHESRFLSHKCKEMVRDEQFRSAEGQAAWTFYQSWMKAYRRLVPNSKAFKQSRFFSSFLKFAKFVKKVHLPDPETFIWLMKEKDISPTIWTNDQVYSLYLEFIDRNSPPLKQADITINTLFDLAEDISCNINQIFDHIDPSTIIQLLRQRRISPWFLLHSGKFKQFYIDQISAEQKIVVETIIRPQYWAKKFQEHPTEVETIRKFIKELEL